MGSIVREIRERQKAEAQASVEKRIAALKTTGVDEKIMERDAYLRHAKAELRKSINRIRAIDAREAIIPGAATEKRAEKGQASAKPAGKAKAQGGAKEKKSK